MTDNGQKEQIKEMKLTPLQSQMT